MKQLPDDLFDLAETLCSGLENGSECRLKEALEDYTNVCRSLEDDGINPQEQAEWNQICSELVAEVIRLTDRLGKRLTDEDIEIISSNEVIEK